MNRLVKSAALIMLMTVVSKLLGFLKEMFLAEKFGTSGIVDAYTVCISLPTVFYTIFASGINHSYLPVWSRTQENKRDRLFSNVINIVVVISVIFAAVSFFLSDAFVSVLAPGFSDETFELCSGFIKTVSLYMPFYAALSIFLAHSTAAEDFIFPYFCHLIVENIILIISIFISGPDIPYILVIGYDASVIVSLFMLAVYMKIRKEYVYHPVFDLKDPDFIELIKLAVPIGLSLFVNQLNAVVDRMFSSSLGDGITSALSYANRIQLIPYSMIVSAFISVINPRLNKSYINGDREKGNYYTGTAFMLTVFISLPIMLVLVFLAAPVIKLLLERGKFTPESTELTAGALLFYSLGIPFYAFREIETKVLTAHFKKYIILINSVLTVVFNLVFNFLFVGLWSHIGLAVSTSLSGFISFIFLTVSTKRLGVQIIGRENIGEIFLIGIVSVVSVGAGTLLYHLTADLISGNIAVIIAVLISAVLYILLCAVFRSKTVVWIYSHLPGKLRFIKSWNK